MVGKASRAGGARRRSGKKTRSRFSIAKGMPPPVETPKSRAAARREGGARSARGAAGRARGTGSRARGRADRSTDVPETPRTRPTRACEAPREARLRVGWTRVRFSASVKRRGAWAAVFGAGTRARCEFGERPGSVSSRVAATGATRPGIGGEIEAIPTSEARVVRVRDVRPARSGHRGRSHCVGGGGVGQSRKGRRKYKTM